MSALEPLSEEVFVELRELRWLECKSSSLELAVIGRSSHGTDSFDRLIIAVSPETLEFGPDDILIVFYIVPNYDIGGIEESKNLVHNLFDIGSILYVTVVDSMDLRCRKRDGDAWFHEDIYAVEFRESVHTIYFPEDSCKLYDVRLFIEITVTNRESCRFSIEYECFHEGWSLFIRKEKSAPNIRDGFPRTTLEELFVIIALKLGIHSSDEFENDSDYDDKSGSRDEEVDLSTRSRCIEELNDSIELGHKVWEYCDEREEWSSVEIQVKGSLFKILSSLSSWTNPWDVSTTLLDTLSYFISIENDRDIEERESEYEEEVNDDVYPAWIIHREVLEEELSDLNGFSWTTIRENLTDEGWECYDRHGEDDRYHPCLIDSYREVWFLVSSCSCIDERDLPKSFGKLDDDIDNPECHDGKNEEEWVVTNGDVLHDMWRNSGQNSREDDHRASVSDSWFVDDFSEPHEEESTSRDEQHGRKHSSPEIAHIHDLSASTDEGVEEDDHTVTLRKRERNSHPSSVVVDLLLTLFSFFLHSLELWNDNRQELHDDDRIDVRSESHEDYREVFQSSTHEWAEERESLIGSEKILDRKKRSRIHSWYWDDREELVENDDTEGNDDFFLYIRGFPDTGNIFENHKSKNNRDKRG